MNYLSQKTKNNATLKPEKVFKYSINEKLTGMEEHARVRKRRLMLDTCKISESTLTRYINLRHTDQSDIPAGVLRTIANILYVSMEDLFNEKPTGR